MLGRLGREPDVGDDDPAGMKAPGSDDESDLRRVERHGEICVDNRAGDVPSRRIHTRREIDRHDRRGCGVNALDDLGGLRSRLAAKAGPEQRVDDTS